jgi:DNA end-binding protein Ku
MAARRHEREDAGDLAPRSTWKGTLKLSLIQIPIRVFPATNPASDVRFRQLHRKCHTPIQLKKWCPHCNEEVTSADIVRGYEVSKGRFSIVEEEEIKKLRPESTRIVDISSALDEASLDPVYIERSYVVLPDGKAAAPAFAVIRDALGDTAMIGHLALHGREYLVALVARDSAVRLYTLRTKGEVRDLSRIEDADLAAAKPKADEVRLAKQVMASLDHAPDLSAFTDHYQEALRAMLERKEVEEVAEGEPGAPTKVVDLRDALRRSLERVRERTPASGRVLSHTSSHGTRSSHKRRKAS